jgi:hypothetical protein
VTYKDTVREAAYAAARHAMPELPKGLVRWEDEPNKQPDPKHPTVTLSTVSHTGHGNVSLNQLASPDGTKLSREFGQRWFWVVQVKVEGWRGDLKTDANPWRVINRMRFGWRTLACQRAMDDLPEDRPFTTRHPVKMVDDPGEIRDVTSSVAGHRLPQYIYEIEFSYVDYDVDAESDATLEHVELHGHIGGTTDGDAVVITTDP